MKDINGIIGMNVEVGLNGLELAEDRLTRTLRNTSCVEGTTSSLLLLFARASKVLKAEISDI